MRVGGEILGVFDSGVGGLHVLAALRRALPGCPTVYLGDTARLPYGNKSAPVVRAYARRCAERLVAEGATRVVIACNTASAVAEAHLADSLGVPVVGVVAAGARAAAQASTRGKIAVVATHATIASGAYRRALAAAAPGSHLWSRACPLWVPLAEEDMAAHPAARLIVADDLAGLAAQGIDTLLLGCTHYPLLRPLVDQVAGPAVQIVDPANAVAAEVAGRATTIASNGPPAPSRLLTTDPGTRLWRLATRILGRVPSPEHVDL